MNGVKNETHVRVEQTARGIWYCSGVDVYGENSSVLRQELQTNMVLVEEILSAHNKPADSEEVRADLTTVNSDYTKPGKMKR
jgi:hypothetical protein